MVRIALRWNLLGLCLSLSLGLSLWAPCPGLALAADGEPSVWDLATQHDAAGNAVRRFIPPELYSGAPWSGSREMVLRPMNVTKKPSTPSDHPAITISGPVPWDKDPSVPVLIRTRVSKREGEVRQVFTINERGDGLGRLSDQRSTRGTRDMAECFKFPLGEWQEGETRVCKESTIRIIKLDYTHAGAAHSLKFRWNDEGAYVFSPERGMVSVEH